ncbi:hypothetical protein AYO44_03735 [Planctomycetaceae bacterium SCGC AG-212-F19]|nr:hypothetical protein AYO44_03735 [Planctomycetaceae bacterium SCGC AG-212-F19]
MLFAVKNRLVPTLLVLALLVAAAFWLRIRLGLTWSFAFQTAQWRDLFLAILVMAASDGVVHGLLTLVFGERYRVRYRALAEFFSPQHVPQMIAGGLLAGGEELLFRGVMLEALRTVAGLHAIAAVSITALVFGLAHTILQRLLWPFTFWAIWEGVLLGGVYVLSGSLAVVVVLHVLHDIVGFVIFAFQRRSSATISGSPG